MGHRSSEPVTLEKGHIAAGWGKWHLRPEAGAADEVRWEGALGTGDGVTFAGASGEKGDLELSGTMNGLRSLHLP